MSDEKLLREFIRGTLTEEPVDDNVTQPLTSQQVDYRLEHGCPVCGSELFKRPRMTGDVDDQGKREFVGNFYVCRRNPDPNHYNLGLGTANKPARERYRGRKPETRDAVPGPLPNDGSKRIVRGRLPPRG